MAQAFVVLIVKKMVRMEIPLFGEHQISNEDWIEELKKRIFDETDHTLSDKKRKKIRNALVELGIYGDMFKDRAKELDKGNT